MAPTSKTTPATPAVPQTKMSFGFNDYAERINGRFAMIGIVSMFVLEITTNQTLIAWAGISLP
jgi:hypothetical protein